MGKVLAKGLIYDHDKSDIVNIYRNDLLQLSTFIDNEELLVLPGNDLIEIFAAWPISLLSRQVVLDLEAGKQFLSLQ